MKNNLVEAFASIISSKSITEMLVSYDRWNGIRVESYDSEKLEDKNYIGLHKNDIYNFLNDGYIAAGLGKFEGCHNAQSVKKNTSFLRVVRKNDDHKILAMSIYSGHQEGKKCVGITKCVTYDSLLNELGKLRVKTIIKMDISMFQDYFWIECDGAIKHYWEKFGGVKIPNKYLPCIFKNNVLQKIEFIEGEEYDYYRTIGMNDSIKVRKCVFGFNKKEILDKYIEEQNESVDKLIEKIKIKQGLNESSTDDYDMIPIYQEFLRNYVEEMIECYTYTFTEYELEKIKNYSEILKTYYNKYSQIIDGYNRNMIEMCLDNISDLLNEQYTILKPYTLDDYLECAEDIISPEKEPGSSRMHFEI